jgi:peptidoglycan/xylan/chitin deacetylase (PgdA/CDA1 family)
VPTADHFISTRVVDPALAWARRKGIAAADAPRLPILMYHSLSDDAEPGVNGYYRLNTPPALFREHLQILRDEGFAGVDLTTAWDEWHSSADSGARSMPRRNLVAITFDDGYRDFLTAGWPALAEFGFTATMFLPTAFIADKRLAFKDRPCLTWEEVRLLRDQGVEFGSHTITHPKLWELAATDLDHELSESRRVLEEKLESPVTTFAHPYAFPYQDAAYVQRFRDSMTRAGYRLGVTTSLGRAKPQDDPLLLKRLPANGADDAALFRAKLHGAYDWLALPQRAVKSVKSLLRR